jgi:hypothetical protein
MSAVSRENLGTQSSQFHPLEWPFPAATLLFGELPAAALEESRLTRSPHLHTVPTAPSTELPRLMAPQVASASAKVSWAAGRGRNRLGAFLRR